MRKKPAALSVPLRRKEEFSLFKVSDDEYKVKISPQLLLATQRFLSRGEDEGWFLSPLSCLPVQWVRRPPGQPLPSRPSKQESVQEPLCAPRGCPGSRDTLLDTQVTQGDCSAPPDIQKQGQAGATCASLRQEASAGGVCGCQVLLCWEGTRLEGQPGDSRWAAASVWLHWPLRAQWTLSSLCHGQRWMCSAHCESPRRSCCTC